MIKNNNHISILTSGDNEASNNKNELNKAFDETIRAEDHENEIVLDCNKAFDNSVSEDTLEIQR